MDWQHRCLHEEGLHVERITTVRLTLDASAATGCAAGA
jgi:hypothetical protein